MGVRKVVVKNNKASLVSVVFEEFQLKNKARNLSTATIRGYQEAFQRFVRIIGSDLTCDSINISSVEQFTFQLMSDGLKSSSINHYLRSIRSFLYWSIDLPPDPCASFRVS